MGARRGTDGSWLPALDPESLRAAVHDNLRNLGVDVLDVVNLRVGADHDAGERPTGEPFEVLAELRQEGLIRHLGVSAVTGGQLTETQAIAIAPVVTVRNLYNLANREDDALVERCAAENIAFAPFFPLGGFSPLQSQTLADVARWAGRKQQLTRESLRRRAETGRRGGDRAEGDERTRALRARRDPRTSSAGSTVQPDVDTSDKFSGEPASGGRRRKDECSRVHDRDPMRRYGGRPHPFRVRGRPAPPTPWRVRTTVR